MASQQKGISKTIIRLNIEDTCGLGHMSGITWGVATTIPAATAEKIPSHKLAIPIFVAQILPDVLDKSTPLPGVIKSINSAGPSCNVEDVLACLIPPSFWHSGVENTV